MKRISLKLKFFALVMIGLTPFITLHGQDLKKAITLTDNEQFRPAWKVNESLVKQQPRNSDMYFS